MKLFGMVFALPALGWGVNGFLHGEAAFGQDVVIESQRSRPSQVRSRRHEGRRLLSLKDLARSLNLRQREDGPRIRLEGPRGTLALTDGRSVVSSPGPDILLSAPVWRRRGDDWYVPEDFLVRALPQILDAALTRSSPQRYRLEPVQENQVAVRLNNYPPDRIRIVFQPQQAVAPRITELPGFILVEFQDYRVVPQMPRKEPDKKIVQSLEFNPHHAFGSFRILKGERFGRFEEFQLQAPFRQVLDIYAFPDRPAAREFKKAPPPAAVTIPPFRSPPSDSPGEVGGPPANKEVPVLSEPPLSRNPTGMPVITLDPGHGGADVGQAPPGEAQDALLEKAFTLQIANRISRLLGRSSYQPVLTRTRDFDITLEQRSAIANNYQPRAFVSLHLGKSRSDSVSGPIVYIHKGSSGPVGGFSEDGLRLLPWDEGQRPHQAASRRLAALMQQRLNALFGSSNRVMEVPLTVLAPVDAPAILVELGFVSNPSDAEKLRSPEFQERMAAVMAAALEQFLP